MKVRTRGSALRRERPRAKVGTPKVLGSTAAPRSMAPVACRRCGVAAAYLDKGARRHLGGGEVSTRCSGVAGGRRASARGSGDAEGTGRGGGEALRGPRVRRSGEGRRGLLRRGPKEARARRLRRQLRVVGEDPVKGEPLEAALRQMRRSSGYALVPKARLWTLDCCAGCSGCGSGVLRGELDGVKARGRSGGDDASAEGRAARRCEAGASRTAEATVPRGPPSCRRTRWCCRRDSVWVVCFDR